MIGTTEEIMIQVAPPTTAVSQQPSTAFHQPTVLPPGGKFVG